MILKPCFVNRCGYSECLPCLTVLWPLDSFKGSLWGLNLLTDGNLFMMQEEILISYTPL